MTSEQEFRNAPVMQVGKYAGVSMDKLPVSYLRWMLMQNFPKMFVEFAKKKVEASDYNNMYMGVTRHAIDMFSKRFLHLWQDHARDVGHKKADGLASFMCRIASEAWETGEDISKHRHQDEGIVKKHMGVKWVFVVSPHYHQYKEVITVM